MYPKAIIAMLLCMFLVSCAGGAVATTTHASQRNNIPALANSPTATIWAITGGPDSTPATFTPIHPPQPTPSPTKNPVPKPTPTQAPLTAGLGDPVYNFDQKFGKEDNSSGGIGYQPFSPSYPPTDKYRITTNHGHVTSVTVTLLDQSSLDWQDGIKLCQSFLPADAVFQNDQDFAPRNQLYQQMYISKKMAQEFNPDLFVEDTAYTTSVTPGTVQIMYRYTSFSDHTNNAQIKVCYVSLGQSQ